MWQSREQVSTSLVLRLISTAWTKAISVTRPEAKWLAAHCAEYGFVIRYPEDKESVTGIIYEPWHLRFVGVKHAKRMNELNMCLEEYCEYIKSGNS